MDSPQYSKEENMKSLGVVVLNLIINGQSSIQNLGLCNSPPSLSFKPYYKWIVLNTIKERKEKYQNNCFKPYYKWIVLNTLNLKKNIDFMTF